jgi:hypothetical protein
MIENENQSPLLEKSQIVYDKSVNIKVENTQKTEEIVTEYNATLEEYQKLFKEVNSLNNKYFARIDPKNPYLNQNIRFNNGRIAYVTNHGLVKIYENNRVFNGTAGRNGCPNGRIINLDLPWLDTYYEGTYIPTDPDLLVGSPMVEGQSCGNEGINVFTNTLNENPTSRYVGCYNDRPPRTTIFIVPIMTSTNDANGFIATASSVYHNNNSWGPWCVFTRNNQNIWHSTVGGINRYNNRTGNYEGTIETIGTETIRGEWIQIMMPPGQGYTLTEYEIQGRQGCCGNEGTGRSPNNWVLLGLDETNVWREIDRQNEQNLRFECDHHLQQINN